jgi:hypothetical protein
VFELEWIPKAQQTFNNLKNNPSEKKRYNAVKKTLTLLATDPRHNSLQTHEFKSLKGPNGEKIFEAYAEQNTPAAYRILWYYGTVKGVIKIFAITTHS